jgi:hypothetical protein
MMMTSYSKESLAIRMVSFLVVIGLSALFMVGFEELQPIIRQRRIAIM